MRPATDPRTLDKARRAWAAAIDAVADPVFMHDEGGYLMRVNQAYAARAGVPPRDLLGRSFRDVLPEDGTIVRSSDGAMAPCTGQPTDIVLADGGTLTCRRLPVQDEHGVTVCCIHILRERAMPDSAAATGSARGGLAGDQRLSDFEAIVEAFAATMELSTPSNASHGRRVAALASAIGYALPLSETQLTGTRLAALVHDLGSFKIPAELLLKPGKLTDVERLLVQSHPKVGHRILQGIAFPWPIAEIVLEHHERIDGSGYPRGLIGSSMLIEAKIVAVADAMEAMLSDRPYRPRLGVDAALSELVEHRGAFYDPEAVDACVRLFSQGFELPD